jgi:RHS repeat-associated protein
MRSLSALLPALVSALALAQGTTPQTISVFYPANAHTLTAGSNTTLTAKGGGSGNLVTFASTTPAICTIGTSTAGASNTSTATLSAVASGECIITASQAGNAQYAAAQPIDVQLTLGGQPQLYFVHQDHLGSPRVVTQASGNVRVWEWKNADAFGNNLPDENPTGLATAFKYHLRFPGQYFDQETGTHYNYFRDYDPSVGRYIQSDPIGLAGGIGLYVYARSNSLQLIDPFGETPLEPIPPPVPGKPWSPPDPPPTKPIRPIPEPLKQKVPEKPGSGCSAVFRACLTGCMRAPVPCPPPVKTSFCVSFCVTTFIVCQIMGP